MKTLETIFKTSKRFISACCPHFVCTSDRTSVVLNIDYGYSVGASVCTRPQTEIQSAACTRVNHLSTASEDEAALVT